MENFKLQTQLEELIKLKSMLLSTKDVFNLEELSIYTGFSKSYVYKLTSQGKIPYFKPNGKTVFFERKEIDSWLLTNKQEVKEQDNGRTIEV